VKPPSKGPRLADIWRRHFSANQGPSFNRFIRTGDKWSSPSPGPILPNQIDLNDKIDKKITIFFAVFVSGAIFFLTFGSDSRVFGFIFS